LSEGGGYLLALYASPRRKGNTSLLLDALVSGAEEAGLENKAFRVAEMDIRPCRACNACFGDGECVQEDDMQEIYPHLLESDAVAMAAPIFSMNICAQAKALIDRCQRFWSARYVLGRELVEQERAERRRGFFLSCCGRNKPETFDCTRPVMGYFFYIIRVGSWTPLTFSGVDEAGSIRGVEGALEAAAGLGRSIATH
jgi:putative NADPH-quinone reductase